MLRGYFPAASQIAFFSATVANSSDCGHLDLIHQAFLLSADAMIFSTGWLL
jgi:hypothetical protein